MLVIGLCGAGGRVGWGSLDGVELGELAASGGGGLACVRWGVTKSMKYSILQGFTAMVRMGDSIGDRACAEKAGARVERVVGGVTFFRDLHASFGLYRP